MKTLSIIIVNWNSGAQLKGCLRSIEAVKKSRFDLQKVIVVDNSSSDGSMAFGDMKLPLEIIINKRNLGFARACNIGADGCKSDFILFLNPDTRLFLDSLDNTFEFAEKVSEKFGILGVKLVDENLKVQRTCARFPKKSMYFFKAAGLARLFPSLGHFMLDWDHQSTKVADQVMGAFFLVKTQLYRELKGFDERFFVYYEEVDFSLRAKKKGYDSIFFAGASVYHKGGGSSENVKGLSLYYLLKSRILYEIKHRGKVSGAVVLIITLFEYPGRIINKRGLSDMKNTNKAYKLLFKSLKSIFNYEEK